MNCPGSMLPSASYRPKSEQDPKTEEALEEDPDAMGVESLGISQEIARRLAPQLDPLASPPRKGNRTQRRLMEPPSHGATSVAVGRLGARSIPLASTSVVTDPLQERPQSLPRRQLLPPHQHQRLLRQPPLVG
jgi:hypothetical protein